MNSVTHWLNAIRSDKSSAVEQLWDRYFRRLVALANDHLGSQPRRMADEEDIALSVFDTLVRGAANGKFPLLHDRYDLWHLLVALTRQKVVDLRRFETRQKRGQGLVKNVAVLGYNPDRGRMMTLDDLVGDAPSPEYIIILSEEYRHAMQILNDGVLLRIAKDKLEGYTNAEIAERLDISQRTVQRKLILIQNKWIQHLAKRSE